MSVSSRDCQERIKRASESIRNLDQEIQDYLEAHPYKIEREQNNALKKYSFWATGHTIPERFPILAGEILHNLRSPLDHMVTGLVESRKKTTNKKHRFPIADTEEKFEQACKSGALNGLSNETIAKIRNLQPFTRADSIDADLSILHSYNIEDKHRRPLVAFGLAAIGNTIKFKSDGNATIGGMSPPSIHQVGTSRVEVFSIDLVEPIPSFDITADFKADIALKNFGRTPLMPIVQGLTQLRDRTADVITQFSDKF